MGPSGKAPSLSIPLRGPAVGAQLTPARAATGLWRGEGELHKPSYPRGSREGERVEASMGVGERWLGLGS